MIGIVLATGVYMIGKNLLSTEIETYINVPAVLITLILVGAKVVSKRF